MLRCSNEKKFKTLKKENTHEYAFCGNPFDCEQCLARPVAEQVKKENTKKGWEGELNKILQEYLPENYFAGKISLTSKIHSLVSQTLSTFAGEVERIDIELDQDAHKKGRCSFFVIGLCSAIEQDVKNQIRSKLKELKGKWGLQ